MMDVEHFTPDTLDEAAALLMGADSHTPPRVRGTDLIAEMQEGPRTSSIVVDLRRIPEMNRLDYDERNGLRIGAAVPFTTLLAFPPVRQFYPILEDGTSLVGPVERQDRATLGENLDPTAPSADVASPLICLRASAAIFGPHGWSELGVEGLFLAQGMPGLQPGEFVVDVRLPAPHPRSNGFYLRSLPQEGMNTAMPGVGAFLVMEADLFTCCGARLVISAVAPTPLRALEAERFLAGKRLEDAALREAGEMAARSVRPTSEVRGSVEQRFDLIPGLTPLAIMGALKRVQAAATA